jgi:hypothetical protein
MEEFRTVFESTWTAGLPLSVTILPKKGAYALIAPSKLENAFSTRMVQDKILPLWGWP